jgi:hypothetical protein
MAPLRNQLFGFDKCPGAGGLGTNLYDTFVLFRRGDHFETFAGP